VTLVLVNDSEGLNQSPIQTGATGTTGGTNTSYSYTVEKNVQGYMGNPTEHGCTTSGVYNNLAGTCSNPVSAPSGSPGGSASPYCTESQVGSAFNYSVAEAAATPFAGYNPGSILVFVTWQCAQTQ
jgi:hypothetical protein